MKVITLAKTKELLGITDTASDTAISAKIPFIDAKVKLITNNRYNLMILGSTTLDSPYVTVSSVWNTTNWLELNTNYGYGDGINNPYVYDSIEEFLQVGQLISGTGIPADAYIAEIFYIGDVFNDGVDDFDLPTIQLSANATATGTVKMYLGINIGYQDIIAKGIQYLINGTSTSLPSNALSSKSIGPVSKSFSSGDQQIDNRYGMPAWFVKAFPKFMSGH